MDVSCCRYGQRDAAAAASAALQPPPSGVLILVLVIGGVPNAPANRWGDKRAPGVSLLPSHLLLLLLPEASLPGQARAVGHPVRLRVLQPSLSHQEQPDHPQEPPAPRLQRRPQASTEEHRDEDVVHAAVQRPGTAAPPAAPPAMKTVVPPTTTATSVELLTRYRDYSTETHNKTSLGCLYRQAIFLTFSWNDKRIF